MIFLKAYVLVSRMNLAKIFRGKADSQLRPSPVINSINFDLCISLKESLAKQKSSRAWVNLADEEFIHVFVALEFRKVLLIDAGQISLTFG